MEVFELRDRHDRGAVRCIIGLIFGVGLVKPWGPFWVGCCVVNLFMIPLCEIAA